MPSGHRVTDVSATYPAARNPAAPGQSRLQVSPADADREQLLSHLQSLSGVAIRSLADARSYVAQLPPRSVLTDPAVLRLRSAKRSTLALILSLAALQYHLLDVMNEAVSLKPVVIMAPSMQPLQGARG